MGEYFPKRSEGSLQVRYSTHLKSRCGRSGGLNEEYQEQVYRIVIKNITDNEVSGRNH